MQSYRSALPQLGGDLFLTEVGLETSLIFYDGIELPYFATFPLLDTEDAKRRLREYYRPLLRLARENHTGFILDTLTWRANPDWGAQLGYDGAALARANRLATTRPIRLLQVAAGPCRYAPAATLPLRWCPSLCWNQAVAPAPGSHHSGATVRRQPRHAV